MKVIYCDKCGKRLPRNAYYLLYGYDWCGRGECRRELIRKAKEERTQYPYSALVPK